MPSTPISTTAALLLTLALSTSCAPLISAPIGNIPHPSFPRVQCLPSTSGAPQIPQSPRAIQSSTQSCLLAFTSLLADGVRHTEEPLAPLYSKIMGGERDPTRQLITIPTHKVEESAGSCTVTLSHPSSSTSQKRIIPAGQLWEAYRKLVSTCADAEGEGQVTFDREGGTIAIRRAKVDDEERRKMIWAEMEEWDKTVSQIEDDDTWEAATERRERVMEEALQWVREHEWSVDDEPSDAMTDALKKENVEL